MWHHDNWFAPIPADAHHPVLDHADELVAEARIEEHPFFELAGRSRPALRIWVAQEVVVTGPFSQLLLALAAKITNVHVRAMVVEVAYGEHGAPGMATADTAHPWLLDKLRSAMHIDARDLRVLPETSLFLKQLSEICEVSPLAALGALGIGSEKLLVPEYSAIKASFDMGWPDCGYHEFLDANIDDDTWHAELMARAAGALIVAGGRAEDFIEGARVSIDSRIAYYTNLLTTCKMMEGALG